MTTMEKSGSHIRVSAQRKAQEPPDPVLARGLRRFVEDELEMSHEEFARSIDTSRETFRRWITAQKNPHIRKILKIEQVHGVSLASLRARGEADDEGPESDSLYTALAEFLATPEGKTCTREEIAELRREQYSHGSPTVLSYHYKLLSLRAKERGKAVPEPPPTSVVVREGGMKVPKR